MTCHKVIENNKTVDLTFEEKNILLEDSLEADANHSTASLLNDRISAMVCFKRSLCQEIEVNQKCKSVTHTVCVKRKVA
jgi:hypothetical protein